MGDVKEVELAACPFCAGEARKIETDTGWRVECDNDVSCNVEASVWLPDEAEAITAWNTRPASTGKGEGADLVEASQSLRSVPQRALPETWQDISTAPRDGTDILAATGPKGAWFQCTYDDEDERWYTFNQYLERDKHPALAGQRFEPAIWIPLPTSNDTEKGGSEPRSPQTAAHAPAPVALPMPEYRYQQDDLSGGSAVTAQPQDVGGKR